MTKRKREDTSKSTSRKRQSTTNHVQSENIPPVQHPVLSLHYHRVYSLGKFLKARLPETSRNRRKRLELFPLQHPHHAAFLDSVLIGLTDEPSREVQNKRRDELVKFTQTQRIGHQNSHLVRRCDIGEVVDFAIWLLFKKDSKASRGPSHLLCHGFQRSTPVLKDHVPAQGQTLPGIVQRARNANVEIFKQPPWTDIANLLGEDGELIILSLLLDCAVFQRLDSGKDNLYQLSGLPISWAPVQTSTSSKSSSVAPKRSHSCGQRKPSAILFVRSRMLYARAVLNGQDNARLGLKQLHALNRYNNLQDRTHDLRVAQYIFPRQFGLHNVFTSSADSNGTGQPSRDYTMRDQELTSSGSTRSSRLPHRIRGSVVSLVQRLRKNHTRCSYTQLLRYYCAVSPPSSTAALRVGLDVFSSNSTRDQLATQVDQLSPPVLGHRLMEQEYETSFMPHATPVHHVSAFCKAVLRTLLPWDTLGVGGAGTENWARLLCMVDKFLSMRRFESISLHEVTQNIQLKCIGWLRPPKVRADTKLSATDKAKRLEIFHEFLYYVFDSILMPLVRSNFYVTETAVYRNRLSYFRHDVWRRMSVPSLATLQVSMFRPLRMRQAQRYTESSGLGCGHVRLLPKEHGVRPITNLKRKATRIIKGRKVSGASINTQLAPIFSILSFERQRHPEVLGSAIFSVGEIEKKLKEFKARVGSAPKTRFYFVKVDIRSCFDTIPQKELLDFVNSLLSSSEYRTTKHVEIKRLSSVGQARSEQTVKRFVSRTLLVDADPPFSPQVAEQMADSKRRQVFVGLDHKKVMKSAQVRKILADHLTHNIVRIGRKYFKQVEGIPQGSVVSSLLCNLFYGDFERSKLGFLDPSSSLLLRLIDDFLLITTEESQARRFAHAMSSGNIEYGISINADKSLVNFDMSINGCRIPQLHSGHSFPYCGIAIDMRDLQLRRDRQRKDVNVGNGLTVDLGGRVGALLQRRVLSSIKLQMHSMLLDRTLNSRERVLGSLFECFVESCMKMHRYRDSLPRRKQPSQGFLIDLCRQLIDLAFKMSHNGQPQDRFLITKSQMNWIATAALYKVLETKQSAYPGLLPWLQTVERQSRKSMSLSDRALQDMTRGSLVPFQSYVY